MCENVSRESYGLPNCGVLCSLPAALEPWANSVRFVGCTENEHKQTNLQSNRLKSQQTYLFNVDILDVARQRL